MLFFFGFLFFFMFMVLFILGMNFILNEITYLLEFSFFILNSVSLEFMILLDWMSLMFMSFVLLISSMVIIYSDTYMEYEVFKIRFIMLVVLFVLSMMFLILSPNLISILLGWDGLGLVSYCLVIFYQNIKSYNAGMLTVIMNRVGDAMMLIAIAWMMNYGSWNLMFYMEYFFEDKYMFMVAMFVMVAALTKSAQMPFSSWLPAAMAAPTPVSALVHSSTLVTAGVYLLIRFNFLIKGNLTLILLFIGLMTMFMSGLSANMEFDLKKIIALSTLSQLGLMMSILALGSWILAFFHLLIHALFKALLFMCAGMIIHSSSNIQDIRFLGGLYKNMPLTLSFMNISNLSLCGLPFFSGFYSKDLILEFISMNYLNLFVYVVFYISIGLTVAYSFRLSYYLVFSDLNFLSLNFIFENSIKMLFSMMVMFLSTLFSGALMMWLILEIPYLMFMPLFMKLLTLIMIILGIFLGFEISKIFLTSNLFSLKFKLMFKFFALMWNLPFISTFGVNYIFMNLGFKIFKFLDQGWIEFMGAQGLSLVIKNSSLYLQSYFKNNFKIYFMMLILWVVFLFLYM
uniref:NADH-ubiquinone oxidoreductase chain 5 n=1 Tax=Henosepilachna vigintioctopunctata TaxID=420089 RepID=A0A411DAJ7_9CUCU|nr:NADH dehydrogenase subunit 5 [Henosepilachna vigintioctopunctata]QAY82223.1 NADH dehydrogenase subunit 5 [Henosepilachna vigintioctopunctata]